MTGDAGAERPVRRFTGVYDADGSPIGELRYLVGRTFGSTHCALCDITHGRLRPKQAWKDARAELPVPFDTVHLDERTSELRAVTEGVTPCVLAHTDDGLELLLGPTELDACAGDPAALVSALEGAMGRHQLSYG